MAEVLVRDLKADVVTRLKARAKRNGRSLQAELKDIIQTASRQRAIDATALAARIRQRLRGRSHTDSVALLAEDRAR